MASRQQIRNRARILINQPDGTGDFTNSELDGFANEGIVFLASRVRHPRDRIEIQVELDTPVYTFPKDMMMVYNAYFGNENISGDKKPLRVLTEEQIKEIRPTWLDNTSSSQGRPDTLVVIDKKSCVLNPRPNADESATGKKLEIVYVYYPTPLNAEGDEPDLPFVYHDLISQYAASKCYMSKLNNPVLGQAILREVLDKAKEVEFAVTTEISPLHFAWGNDDDMSDVGGEIILP